VSSLQRGEIAAASETAGSIRVVLPRRRLIHLEHGLGFFQRRKLKSLQLHGVVIVLDNFIVRVLFEAVSPALNELQDLSLDRIVLGRGYAPHLFHCVPGGDLLMNLRTTVFHHRLKALEREQHCIDIVVAQFFLYLCHSIFGPEYTNKNIKF